MDWVIILQTLITLLLAAGVIGIFSMRDQLAKLNGSVRELRIWKEEHKEQNDRWHKENRQDHDQMWTAINKQ